MTDTASGSGVPAASPEELLATARRLFTTDREQSIKLAAACLEQARAADRPELACSALNLLAEDLFPRDQDAAIRYARDALELARRAGRLSAAADSLNMLADAERLAGRLESALTLLQESVACARAGNDRAAEATAVTALGAIAWHRGEFDLAINWFREALRLREELGNDYDIAIACANLGLMHYEKGELVPALELSRRSLALREALGDHHGIGEVSINLGLIYVDLGDWEKALESYFRALAELESARDIGNQALVHCNIGEAYLRRGKLARAREHLDRALALARTAGSRFAEAEALGNLGESWFDSGDTARAADFYQRDAAICREIEDREELAETLRRWAEVDLAQGDLAAARLRLDEALAIAEHIGNRKEQACIRRVLGELHAVSGDLAAARVAFEASRALLRTLGKNYELGRTLLALARAEAAAGEGDRIAATQAWAIFENLGIRHRAEEAGRLIGAGRAGAVDAELLHAIAEIVCENPAPAELCRRVLAEFTSTLNLAGAAIYLRDDTVYSVGEAAGEAGGLSIPLETAAGRLGTLMLYGDADAASLRVPARLVALGLGFGSSQPATAAQPAAAGRFPGIVGADTTLKPVFETVERVAPTRATVLILGEHGTGKELVARALHDASDRASGPFVAVNCAAIPETLLEAELFGVEKGTATGVAAREGKFETASGGTLFLDEIGDMSLALQAKLLRVLQERVFERVGGRKPVEVDVRVVAATNRNLEAAMAAGSFRSDLYYRLSVITIRLPSLRERKADIPALATFFCSTFAREYSKPVQGFTAAGLDCLLNWSWPGNVRELKNVVERAVIMTAQTLIGPEDLPAEMRCAAPVGPGLREMRREAKDRAAAEAEQTAAVSALEACSWNVSRAADKLGISRMQLYRIIKRRGLKRPKN